MNTFDKFVIENLKFVKNEFVTVIIALIVLIFLSNIDMFFNPGVSIVFFIATLAAYIPLYFTYKKIFYDTVYGKNSTLFNQLPVTKEEVVVGKILAVAIIAVVMQIIAVIGIKITGHNMFEGLEGAVSVGSYALDTVKPVLASAATGAILFFAISFHNKVPKELRTKGRFITAVIIFLLIDTINMRGGLEISRVLNFENPLHVCLIEITVSILVLIAGAYGTLRFLEKSDQI